MSLILFYSSTLTLKRCMPTNKKSCWNAVFSGVAPFLDFFFRFATDSIILGRNRKLLSEPNSLSACRYCAMCKAVAPPVPGLPLLGAEGLAALHVLWLAEEHLCELH